MKTDKKENVIKKLLKGRNLALKIIKELEENDIQDQLTILDMLDKLPDLPSDYASCELKEFHETKEIYKKLYSITARAIMNIINSDFVHGMHDPSNSFNYSDPKEPATAADQIKYLPKAYSGGPIRAAISSPYKRVNKIALEFYDELPSDMKYSDIFSNNIRKKIRSLKMGSNFD